VGLFALKEPVKGSNAEIICNVDSIVEKRAAFILNGRTHYIDPITTEKFIAFVTKLGEMADIKEDAHKVRDKFLEMIRSVCSSVSKSDVDGLTQMQSISLFCAIRDKVMGKTPEDEKKNP
jgi:hypothetical protein